MTRKIIVLSLLAALWAPSATAQSGQQAGPRQITGAVVDNEGNPVLGATVAVPGTQYGTSTNANGRFELRVPRNATHINITFVGYVPQRVPLGAATDLLVTLEEDMASIEDVVVIGYGSVRKDDLTGSVGVLEVGNAAETLPVTSIDQFMQGRMAGVNITANSGAPGDAMNIQIRGVSTLSGDTQPLYVIDGFPIDGVTARSSGSISDFSSQPTMDPLMSINPNDIQSIQVLKDASATAIYGSRGANGVVLISTKQGDAGTVKINYNFRSDVSSSAKTYDLLDGYTWSIFKNELSATKNGLNMDGTPAPTNSKPEYSEDQLDYNATHWTDWQKLMYRTAWSQDHNLSIMGGNRTSTFNLSGGYVNQKGIIINTGLERYTFKLNYKYNISQKFNFNVMANYAQSTQDQTSHSQTNSSNQMIRRILAINPLKMPYDREGEEDETGTGEKQNNPYIMATEMKDRLIEQNVRLNGNINYQITDALTAKVGGSLMSATGQRKCYYPHNTEVGDRYGGVSLRGDTKRVNKNFDAQLNYGKLLQKTHRINAMAAWEYNHRLVDAMEVQNGDYADDVLMYNAIGQGATTTDKSSSYVITKLSSFIGRANYSYKDKYVATVTGRYDGSSILAEGNRWKFFPSAALAWNMNREEFMRSIDNVISKVKWRLSYGQTGNQNISYGAPYCIMNSVRILNNGESIGHGYVPGSLANPELGWEHTTAYNAGLELGFVKNRYRLTVEAYDKVTDNLLFNFPLPASAGTGNIPVNMGKISNRGIEVELGADIITHRHFKWSVSANWYLNRNKVLNMDGNFISGATYMTGSSDFGSQLHRTAEGYPIGSFFGYVVRGVYQTEQEAAAAPRDTPVATAGTLRYLDLSGPDGLPDGQIDAYDMTILGSYQPDFNYGLSSDFSWKGLKFSFMITGRQGGKIANMNRYILDAYHNTGNLTREAWNKRWTGPGTSNFYPAVNGGDGYGNAYFQRRFSTFHVEDGSYVRLQNVTLSYAFGLNKVQWVKSINVFVTGTNLVCLTKYKGYDPEVSISRSALSPNVDYSAFPQCRTISFGVNLGF
ncbi:SusC/RagA family TonB-linked outer membrane protein [Bacteroidia bacterium]|nr:SusC/RagA family TonB-linked outer membrane protein [Bacteroidia bacterium]